MKNYKRIILFIGTSYCLNTASSQNIGINATGNSPDVSAALDIDISNKGLLIPRVNLTGLTDNTTIASPTTSLLVWNTGVTLTPAGYYYWDGAKWIPFLTNATSTNAAWSLTGNAGTTVGTHFLGTTDAQDFVIKTVNTEKVRIDQNGNVGIGLISPLQQLHVNDNARATSFYVDGVTFMSTSAATGGDDIGFYTGSSTERMSITNTGNVGIGTTDPSAKLHTQIPTGTNEISRFTKTQVATNDIGGFVSFYSGTTGSTFRGMIGFTKSGTGANTVFSGELADAFGIRSVGALHLGPDLGTPPVTIDATGNVGIGATTPQAALDLGNATGGKSIVWGGSSGSNWYASIGTSFSSGSLGLLTGLKFNTAADQYLISYTGTYPVAGIRLGYSSDDNISFFNQEIQAVTEGTVFDYVNNTKLIIKSNGNIGIGTISPTVKTHIYNAVDGIFTGLAIDNRKTYGVGTGTNETSRLILSLSETATPDPLNTVMGYISAGTESETTSAGGFMALGTRIAGSETEKVRITSVGNVGIGTTTPLSLLSLVEGKITVGQGSNDKAELWGGNGFGARLSLYKGTGGSESIRLDGEGSGGINWINSGNVGIGTTTPSSKLNVEVANAFNVNDGINIDRANGADVLGLRLKSDGTGQYRSAVTVKGNGGSEIEAITLDNGAGNIGIGTTSPSGILAVQGGTSTSGIGRSIYLQSEKGAASNNGGDVIIGAGQNGVGANNGNILFGIANAGSPGLQTEFVRILNNGNIGIGTNNPLAQLHTTGTVRFATFGAGTMQTDASGNVSVSSDARLKNITGDFTKGLDAIMGLTPKAYKWNKLSGLDEKEEYSGFIAQNVQQFIPEAVNIDNRGFLTLSDRPIIAALVNAIKEQQQQIEMLKSENKEIKTENTNLKQKTTEIDSLKNQNETLKSEIKSIKTYLGIEAKQ